MRERFITILFLSIGFTAVQGQRTMDDIENHIFSSIFNSNFSNTISELIEENENSEVIRKWKFNKKGLLINEYDWRVSTFSASMGGLTSSSSSTFYKEFEYHYLPNDKIDKIIEIRITDGDTLNITHHFDYLNENEVKESHK